MPPKLKFEIIHAAVSRDNNLLSINKMCELAGVSRSGYYNWCEKADKRIKREDHDRSEFDKVLEAYKFRGYANRATA